MSNPSDIDGIRKRLKEWIENKKLTPTRVGTEAGLSKSALRQFLSGRSGMRIESLLAIQQAFPDFPLSVIIGVEKVEKKPIEMGPIKEIHERMNLFEEELVKMYKEFSGELANLKRNQNRPTQGRA